MGMECTRTLGSGVDADVVIADGAGALEIRRPNAADRTREG
jgi:hypothetical protein